MAEKRRREELREARGEIIRLGRRLAAVREEERARISRQVHDELGQDLLGLEMELTSLASLLGPGSDAVRARIDSILELLETSLASVRRISSDLRSTLVDSVGLAEAIRRHASRFRDHTGLAVDLRVDPGLELEDNLARALFRIFQEALANVIHHAVATRVEVSLKIEHGVVSLQVADDGQGIAPAAASSPTSLGLLGMRERLIPFQGHLEIHGEPGKGTVVSVEVEVERAL